MRFAVLWMALVVQGCAGFSLPSTPEPIKVDPSVPYRREIWMRVEGQDANGKRLWQTTCTGTCVVPRAPKYYINFKSRTPMDFLLVRTCGREEKREREGDDFGFQYNPVPGVEDNRACPLEITAIEKERNRRVWGFLDFQDPDKRTLPVVYKCNGVTTVFPGVGACESGAGLIARFEFQGPVAFDAIRSECKAFQTTSNNTLEIQIPQGRCTILFIEKSEPYRSHRLSLYGFSESLPGNL